MSYASFLSVPGAETAKNSYCVFRARIPANAVLKIYAERSYECRCDGEFLAFGPAKSGDPLLYFDTLRLPGGGEHLVALRLYAREGAPSLSCEAATADGFSLTPEWQCAMLHDHDSASPFTVGDVGYSEFCDLDSPDRKWADADFQSKELRAPSRGRIFNSEHLLPRPIPMLKTTRFAARKLEKTADGLRIDFGEMVYGFVSLSGVRRESGATEVAYLEDLDRGWAKGEGKRIMYADRLSGRAGRFAWRSYAKRGFRYLELSGNVEIDGAFCDEYAYPVEPLGEFRSSDPALAEIWKIAERTLRICMDDIFNDCPHRDQAQWMDAFVSSRTALALFGVTDLAKKSILQHAVCSFKDGKLLSPSIVGWVYLPDYALVQIRFIQWYYHVTGERKLVEELFDNAAKALQWFRPFVASDGLLNDVARDEYVYLDNAFELYKRGKSAALNALWFGALDAMAEMAEAIGRRNEHRKYAQEAAQVRKSYERVFAHPCEKGCLRDSDSRPEYEFLNLNFTRILHKLSASGARAEFRFQLSEARKVVLRSGAYTNYRALLNGTEVLRGTRPNSWQPPAPCYIPESVEVELKKGENVLTFDVEFNGINWDLFFQLPGIETGAASICEIDYASGVPTGACVRFAPRFWCPPYLAQTTHGYAAFSGLLEHPAVLEKTLCDDYFRNFLSIRVPLFCTETDDPAKLAKWVMPANTPWTMFFYLSGLFDAGCASGALALLRRAWGVMTSRHATNAWEEWGENASLCHAWSATPCYFLLHDILGVHAETIYQNGTILVRPALCNLEFAEGRAAVAPEKTVAVSLKKENGKTLVSVTFPKEYRLQLDLSRLENPVVVSEKAQ